MATVLCVLSHFAAAQTNPPPVLQSATNDTGRIVARTNAWTLGITADYSAVAAGNASFGNHSGNSGAQSANASIIASVPVNEKCFVPFGVSSRNLFLGTVTGVPIPERINTLGFNAGFGYILDDKWTLAGSLGPRFYRLDSVDSDDIGVGGMIRASYRWKPNLTFAFGLAFESGRNVPVLPAAGLRWEIRTNLTLSLMFPTSGVDYRVTPRLNLFAGADGNFAAFRTENDFGNKIGQSQFNNALATYRDFRVGVGAAYQIVRGFNAVVQGGYSFGRQIDYKDVDQTVNFGSAPYIQAALRWRL